MGLVRTDVSPGAGGRRWAGGSESGAWVSGGVERREVIALGGWGARGQTEAGEDGANGVGGFDNAEDLHPVAAASALRI